MNFAENLKRIRKENNLSQEQLAEQLGVSRQAVSKWESGLAYPEMDKVLQLSKMFHFNIDELLNQDIKEVSSDKQSKVLINKYIDDFFSFITKTVDMFSSMKWKSKLKCLFEQCIILFILLFLYVVIGAIGYSILSGIISAIPLSIQNAIYSIFESIYLIIAFVFGFILLIHIFKVRYLDYYVIVKNQDSDQEKIEDKENDQETNELLDHDQEKHHKIYLEKKQEKIIIRDPKHSEYKFISGMLKCLLFLIKGITLMIALGISISLIGFVATLVISFLIIKTGTLFLGIFLSLLASIFIHVIILVILFHFITSRKNHKKNLLWAFLLSLILLGIGVGLIPVGLTHFQYISDINNPIYQEDEIAIPMQQDMVIYPIYGDTIEFKEENRDDIRIVYKHTNHYRLQKYQHDYILHLGVTSSDTDVFELIRANIQDINQKKIIDYDKTKIIIYTSSANLQKLKDNYEQYLQR